MWDRLKNQPFDKAFIQKVSKALAPFDRTDLLAGLAALQLVPENADQTLRLELAAGIAAGLPPASGRPKISAKRLGQILTLHP